jgi:hypothetical protein
VGFFFVKRDLRKDRLKRLQTMMPRGRPFDLAALAPLGVTPHLAAQYAKDGWLVRLGAGVYAFPNDPLPRDSCVQFLQPRVAGLHIGGKSALALHGVRHNLSMRDTLVLWGDKRYVLPRWFTSRFASRYVSAALFERPDVTLASTTISTPPGSPRGLLVSCPERAALEMLYDVGTNQGLEEARNLFQSFQSLRKDVVGRLLECCTSVKAVRLFLTWARQTEVLDVEALRTRYRLRVGSENRWMTRLPDGTLLSLKQYG